MNCLYLHKKLKFSTRQYVKKFLKDLCSKGNQSSFYKKIFIKPNFYLRPLAKNFLAKVKCPILFHELLET